jgi:hypothetical protein
MILLIFVNGPPTFGGIGGMWVNIGCQGFSYRSNEGSGRAHGHAEIPFGYD